MKANLSPMEEIIQAAYERGISLEAPNIPRDVSKPLEARDALEDITYIKFYKAGFVKGILFKYGISIKSEEVPIDNVSYEAFMQGLNGVERPSPFETLDEKIAQGQKPHKLSREDTELMTRRRAYEWYDRIAYATGRGIMLSARASKAPFN